MFESQYGAKPAMSRRYEENSRRARVAPRGSMGIYRPPSSASSMSYGKCFSIHSDAPSVSPSTYLI